MPAYKPHSPGDISKPGWAYTAKSAFREFQRDQCTDLAAALTYYSVLSVFPAILALVSLLGVLGQGEATTSALLDIVRQLGQGQVADQLQGPIEQISGARGSGIALVVGLAGALWSASGYVGAFGRAMNRVYQVDEGRPIWKLRPVVLLITVGLVIMAALVLIGLVVSGPVARAIGDVVGLGDASVTAWDIAEVAGHARHRHRHGRRPLLRDAQHQAAEVQVGLGRRRRRDPRAGCWPRSPSAST